MLNCVLNFFGNQNKAEIFLAGSVVEIMDSQNTNNPKQQRRKLLRKVQFSSNKDMICIYPEKFINSGVFVGEICDVVLIYLNTSNELKVSFIELKTTYPATKDEEKIKARDQLKSTSKCFEKISPQLNSNCHCTIANKKTYCIIRMSPPDGYDEDTEVKLGSLDNPFVITTNGTNYTLKAEEVKIIIN